MPFNGTWSPLPIYLFDVDDTLNIGPQPGPVPVTDLAKVKALGVIVGICGNWKNMIAQWPDWHKTCSIIVPVVGQATRHYKPDSLIPIRQFIPARDYVLIGNTTPGMGGISDQQAARISGWRFISETQWVQGAR